MLRVKAALIALILITPFILSCPSGGQSGTKVATPVITPADGQVVVCYITITDSDPTAKIYYTTDGTTPTTASSLYNAATSIYVPTAITTGYPATIKAIATDTGMNNSDVISATYPSNSGC
jgi:hypothetical protein